LSFQDTAGRQYGLQALAQLMRRHPEGLPAGELEDWPALGIRGVCLDVSRGRVPSLAALLRMADALAELRFNHWQLYIEHSFRFASHPLIGQDCDALSPEDLRTLDRHCAGLNIELVPAFASLGHLSKLLSLGPYRHLAEDLGIGAYTGAPQDLKALEALEPGWTLSPGMPEAERFLRELYQDLLPCFQSRRFNACLDEPFDLGWGQSRELCRREGIGAVFARHLRLVKGLAAEFGKDRLLVWGDMLSAHPDALTGTPSDVTVLDWRYDEDSDFDGIRGFLTQGRQAWACPSTNSWACLFPRLPMAAANIRGAARAAARHGAPGLLVTVWGDRGHYNLPECEWHGLALAAECAWSGEAASGFDERFCRIHLGQDDPAFVKALGTLGDAATLLQHGGKESFWAQCLFEAPGSAFFGSEGRAFYRAEAGAVLRDDAVVNRAWVQGQRDLLQRCRDTLATAFALHDPPGLGPAWLYAVDSLLLAADRRLCLGPGGGTTGAADLHRRSHVLQARFAALWRAQSRESGLSAILRRFEASRGPA
jgi:hexosaminidase